MLSSSVTTKGQVTIPIELREKLGIKPGDRVGFVDEGGRILLQRQETAIEAVFGMVKTSKGVTLEQMEEAITTGRSRHAGG
ncbi:MAG: AbrB/MazE/SpoVT family DNA-binding domain-containing protein [Sulfuritalea sp.]|jgi:AbrB family looped-hinge helix DNA binding protein|nr:AbrB/MazE/SpoVT family DNA-binding domain-containing protein [Sulfuritalea sp.]MDP1982239.1 AbrB/MazE/SpoVT family DNA-binding domain-containing protein [Sulfuritalea sp.]